MTPSLLVLPLLAATAMAAEVLQDYTEYNTHIQAESVVYATTVAEVQEGVRRAAERGLKVRTLGSGWSWTKYFVDNAVYVRLVGGDVTAFQLSADQQTLTAGGGTLLYAIAVDLRSRALQFEAYGCCMARNMSQTIGGALATNVHHTGVYSYADITRWVEVVLADGTVRRSYRGEELFMLTIGGGGQTGVIVRACFDVAPRSVFSKVEESWWSRWMRQFSGTLNVYEPMEHITVDYFTGKSYKRVEVQYDPELVGSIDWSTEEANMKPLMDIDGIVNADIVTLKGAYVARGGAFTQDFQYFVPTSLRSEVMSQVFSSALEDPLGKWCGFYLGLTLKAFPGRYVYRSQVYLAGNGYVGRTGAAAKDDFYAISVFVFNMPFIAGPFETCFERVFDDLNHAFPYQIRMHPGKRHGIALDAGVSPSIYNKLDVFDSAAMFR